MASAEQEWLTGASGVRDFYAEIGVNLPMSSTTDAAVRCFANPGAHKHDDRSVSCSVNLASGLWNCHGCGQSGNAYAAALASNYSERAARTLARRYGLFIEQVASEGPERPKLPGERELKRWRHRLLENPRILARLVDVKGWDPGKAIRLGLGWDGERVCFPIRSAKNKIVGVARYLPGHKQKMLSAAGSKRDLFPPPELIRKHHRIFVVEGEPDAVSVFSTGHRAVAVPGASSWRREWGMRLVGRETIILPDCDPQGRALAQRILGDVPDARVVDLEPGCETGMDIGDWVAEAAHEGGLAQITRMLGRL